MWGKVRGSKHISFGIALGVYFCLFVVATGFLTKVSVCVFVFAWINATPILCRQRRIWSHNLLHLSPFQWDDCDSLVRFW